MIRRTQTMRTITTHMYSKLTWLQSKIHGMGSRWKGKFQTYTSLAPKVASMTRAIRRTQIIFTPSKSWTSINMAGACKGILKKWLKSQMRDIREGRKDRRRRNLVENSNHMRRVHISCMKTLRRRQLDTKLLGSLPQHRFLRAYLPLSRHRRSDITSKEASIRMTFCRWNLSTRPLYSSSYCKRLIRRSTRRRCARTGSK